MPQRFRFRGFVPKWTTRQALKKMFGETASEIRSAPEPSDGTVPRPSRRKILGYVGGMAAATVLANAVPLGGRLTAPRTPVPLTTQAPESPIASGEFAAASASPEATATPRPESVTVAEVVDPTTTPTGASASVVEVTPVPGETQTTWSEDERTRRGREFKTTPHFADVLATAAASYVGAVPGRATNIELAARRIDGIILAPGDILSFLDRLGPQTIEAGFRMGYGIVMINGQPRTTPMIGGGICDVSTMLFQAALRSGLGIVERHQHMLWIEHYAAPPLGAIGLDATVDVQPVDFKFQNTTSDPLKIVATYQNHVATLQLVGRNPSWTVTLGKPVITNAIKTDSTLVRQPDPTLPVGKEVIIETARAGFDIRWERTVKIGDRLVDHYQFSSHYLPSRNVVAVGAKDAPLTPTVTPTGSPTPTPTPTASPSALRSATSTGTPTVGQSTTETVQVPSLIGLLEIQAKPLIAKARLTVTQSNYQGPGDVPVDVLNRYSIGAVISQIPPPGATVPLGTKVFLAIRRV